MPQLVRALPKFPAKSMFGTMSNQTVQLRQDKLDAYLRELVCHPEVWRSSALVMFLDDSAKILQSLTNQLRIERVVHLQRLVKNPAEWTKLSGHHRRASFATVAPLEAKKQKRISYVSKPVKPRRSFLLDQTMLSMATTGSEIKETTAPPPPPPPPPVSAAVPESDEESDEESREEAPKPPLPPPVPSLSPMKLEGVEESKEESEDDDEKETGEKTDNAPPRPPPPPTHSPEDKDEEERRRSVAVGADNVLAPELLAHISENEEPILASSLPSLPPPPPPPPPASDLAVAPENAHADLMSELGSTLKQRKENEKAVKKNQNEMQVFFDKVETLKDTSTNTSHLAKEEMNDVEDLNMLIDEATQQALDAIAILESTKESSDSKHEERNMKRSSSTFNAQEEDVEAPLYSQNVNNTPLAQPPAGSKPNEYHFRQSCIETEGSFRYLISPLQKNPSTAVTAVSVPLSAPILVPLSPLPTAMSNQRRYSAVRAPSIRPVVHILQPSQDLTLVSSPVTLDNYRNKINGTVRVKLHLFGAGMEDVEQRWKMQADKADKIDKADKVNKAIKAIKAQTKIMPTLQTKMLQPSHPPSSSRRKRKYKKEQSVLFHMNDLLM
jgi:hypothetical protein